MSARLAPLVVGLAASSLVARTLAAQSDSAARWTPPVGTAVTRIDLDSVDLTAISTLSELLQARVPGLVVRSLSGSVGAAPELLARGRKSLGRPPEPLLVVDGIEAVAAGRSFGFSIGQATSRLDDVPLAQIATVTVLPGIAAASRYGPAAADGAVLVTTRSASTSGRLVGHAVVDGGVALEPRLRSTGTLGLVGTTTTGVDDPTCSRYVQGAGGCRVARYVPFDPFVDAPLGPAGRGRAALDVGWGTARGGWLVTGDAEHADGTLGGNTADRGAVRANAHWRPTSHTAVGGRAAGTDRKVAFRVNDLEYFQRSVYQYLTPVRVVDPVAQRARRADGVVDLSWMPVPGLTARAAAGTSVVDRHESRALSPINQVAQLADGREQISTVRAELLADHAFGPLHAALSGGVERVTTRVRDSTALTGVFGDPFAFFNGFTSGGVASAASSYSRGDAAFATARATWKRLTADVGARAERNSPFVIDDRTLVGATASAALRAVATQTFSFDLFGGASDVPTPIDRRQLVFLPIHPPVFGAPARPALPTWRTREIELGAAVTAPRGTTASVRVYRQRNGEPYYVVVPLLNYASPVTEARIDNRGVEAAVRTRLLDRRTVGLEIGAAFWANRNRLETTGAPELLVATSASNLRLIGRTSQPIVSYAVHPLTSYRDANGDGIVSDREVTVSDALVDAGQADAPRTAVGDVVLRLGRHTTVRALVEHRGGMVGTGADPTEQLGDAPALYDPTTPLDVQARISARYLTSDRGLADATFTRLRELSVALRVTRFLRAPAATLTVGGRNLLTWTRYSGSDPEVTLIGSGTVGMLPRGESVYAQPLPPTVVVRLGIEW